MNAVEGWENKKLSELAEYINGYAFKPDDWGKDGLPIIRIEQLKNPDAPTDYYSGKIPEKNIIKNGDLIFSWSASLFLRIWQRGPAALNQHLFRVVEKEDVDRIFLKLFIEFYLPALTNASHGSTMQHITRKELDRFHAPFPISKPEQAKIAEILSTVDRAVEQTETLIAKQQRIKTGLMQDLLTRGIDEHGNLRSEKTHQFKDSPLGRIPVEWEVVETKRVCILITKGTTPKSRSAESQHYSIPYLRVQNLTLSGQINFSEEIAFIDGATHHGELARSKVFPGDVLQNIVGPPLGKIGIVPSDYPEWNINQAISLFRPNKKVSSQFLCHWLQVPATQTWFDINSKKTSGQQNLTLEHCQQLPIVLPSLQEQTRICLLIAGSEVSQHTGMKTLQKLLALKKALMQDLLTGKKLVTTLLYDAGVPVL